MFRSVVLKVSVQDLQNNHLGNRNVNLCYLSENMVLVSFLCVALSVVVLAKALRVKTIAFSK